MSTFVADQRYTVSRKVLCSGELSMAYELAGVRSEAEAFSLLAAVCGIPVETIRLRPGGLASLPVSMKGKTSITYCGKTPYVAVEPDEHGNLQLSLPAGCTVEVVFNRVIPGARGRNAIPRGKKIIYIA